MGRPDDAHGTAGREGMDPLLALLDARLAKQPWLLGETCSLVDLSVGSVIGYSAYIGAPVTQHARVQEWLARVPAHPAMHIEAQVSRLDR